MTEKEKLIAFITALTPAELDYLASHIDEIRALYEAIKD